MWQIKSLELKPAILDFGSSGQGKCQVCQLFSNEIQLINALELVDWNSKDTQVLICEACGVTHCKSGDWVSFRRSGSVVLILPAANYVWANKEDKAEYHPPAYLTQQGIAYLDFSTYESLRSRHPSVPALDAMHRLTLREAALLFHWNAPGRVLGEPPEIRVHSDAVVGCSEGDHFEQLERLAHLLQTHYEDDSLAQLRYLSSNERVISFYIDAAETVDWEAMAFDGSEYRLLVDSRYGHSDSMLVVKDEA